MHSVYISCTILYYYSLIVVLESYMMQHQQEVCVDMTTHIHLCHELCNALCHVDLYCTLQPHMSNLHLSFKQQLYMPEVSDITKITQNIIADPC